MPNGRALNWYLPKGVINVVRGRDFLASGICQNPVLASSLINTVEPVYYGHVGTSQKCPDYQGVLIFQVSLHDNVSFGTTARCLDYAGVHIFKGPD